MRSVKYKVSMSCTHCEKRVKDKLKETSGVEQFDVNLENKTVEVNFDESQISEQQIQEAISDLGFTVTH